ncbi:hypothetical protein [Treponema sp.]|uniref:hypothetical protein n=1 Tax=Treponema sp. TaxID=166 RepID=UPI00298D83E5|nr:hypothetical protein [Treponema sp.]
MNISLFFRELNFLHIQEKGISNYIRKANELAYSSAIGKEFTSETMASYVCI